MRLLSLLTFLQNPEKLVTLIAKNKLLQSISCSCSLWVPRKFCCFLRNCCTCRVWGVLKQQNVIFCFIHTSLVFFLKKRQKIRSQKKTEKRATIAIPHVDVDFVLLDTFSFWIQIWQSGECKQLQLLFRRKNQQYFWILAIVVALLLVLQSKNILNLQFCSKIIKSCAYVTPLFYENETLCSILYQFFFCCSNHRLNFFRIIFFFPNIFGSTFYENLFYCGYNSIFVSASICFFDIITSEKLQH